MKRKLQFLSIVALTTFMGIQAVKAQTALPGTIEAETGTLAGGAFITNGNGGTLNVVSGFINSGRFAEYSVSVATAGYYDMSVVYLNTSVATNSTSGIRVSIPSLPYNVFGGGFLPAAGSTEAYATATKTGFYLPAGTYIMKVENYLASAGVNINIDSFTVTASTTGRTTVGSVVNITNTNTASNVIEAENYDLGGEGKTSSDTTLGNLNVPPGTTVAYRADNTDVGTSASASNGFVVGGVIANEWLEYTVNVADAGSYKLEITYASGNASTNVTNGKITAATYDTAGTKLNDLIQAPNEIYVSGNSNWNDFRVIESSAFNLNAGTNQIIRISMGAGSVNLDKFKFIYQGPSLGVNDISSKITKVNVYPNPSKNGKFSLSESTKWEVYSISGAKVKQGEGELIDISSAAKGVYILKTESVTKRIIFE